MCPFASTVIMATLKRLWKMFRLPGLSKTVSTDPERSSVSESSVFDETSKPEPFKPTADDEAAAKLWKVYVDQAKEYDEGLLREWKADMEALLIFSALYSASLTAFVIESYKTLQDDPAQNMVDLLMRISQQLSNATVLSPPRRFETPRSALACNIMWFLSLALALACSLLATLVQQWTRDFIHKTAQKPSPIRKARVIAFLKLGLHDFRMKTFVNIIPILLHLSLVLFFGGLVAFLFPVNRVLTYVMAVVLVMFLAVYLTLTLLPLLYLNCPYRTPLSGVLWRAGNILGGLSVRNHALIHPDETLTEAILEKSVTKSQDREKRDAEAIILTMRSLTDDDEILPFIEAIPDILYDFSQNKIRRENIPLFIPLLDSADPELNVWARIAQFVFKCGYWSGDFQTRSSQACSRAIWTLVQVYAYSKNRRHDHFDPQVQLIRSMPSLLKIVVATPSGSDLCSALAALGTRWMHLSTNQDLVLETFQAISPYMDTMPQVSDASLDMFVRALDNNYLSFILRYMISRSKEGKVWHIIQIITLYKYLQISQDSNANSLNFESICNAIYPQSKSPLEIEDVHGDLSFIQTGDPLLALKRHVDKTGVLSDSTDAHMRQCLKLFFSTSRPLCWHTEAQQCRQSVLWYIHRRCEDRPSDNIWETFGMEDLERVGRCVLEQIQEPLGDDGVKQSDIVCLRTFILLLMSDDLQWWGDFFPKLFEVLRTPNLPFKDVEGYPFLQVLLDELVSIRLAPPTYSMYHLLPQKSLEQTRISLIQEYLLPQFLCLDALDSGSFRDTLAVTVVSRYIGLCCEFRVPFHFVGILHRLSFGPWNWRDQYIDEKIQVVFAESVARLVEATSKGLLDPVSAELTLLDVIAFFRGWLPFQWITSRQSAKILLDAFSLYQTSENVLIPENCARLSKRGKKGREKLLKHCRELLSVLESVQGNGLGSTVRINLQSVDRIGSESVEGIGFESVEEFGSGSVERIGSD